MAYVCSASVSIKDKDGNVIGKRPCKNRFNDSTKFFCTSHWQFQFPTLDTSSSESSSDTISSSDEDVVVVSTKAQSPVVPTKELIDFTGCFGIVKDLDFPRKCFPVNGYVKTIDISLPNSLTFQINPGITKDSWEVSKFHVVIYHDKDKNIGRARVFPVVFYNDDVGYLMMYRGMFTTNITHDPLLILKCLSADCRDSVSHVHHVRDFSVLSEETLMKLFMSQYAYEKFLYNNTVYFCQKACKINVDPPSDFSGWRYINCS